MKKNTFFDGQYLWFEEADGTYCRVPLRALLDLKEKKDDPGASQFVFDFIVLAWLAALTLRVL